LYLILSIFLASILGLVLFISGPWVGGILAFGIIAGCLFRGLYLLNDIHRKLSDDLPRADKAKEVYDNYLRDKEENGQR
jgi:divalent metal cation (Fe/Co/Zn/Cd) transporter